MMRPTMEQLLDYVRDGETDPLIADMLEHDPDARAKLLKARFICGMIGQQPTPDSGRPLGAALEDLAPMFSEEAASLRAPEPRLSKRASLRIVEPPDGRKHMRDLVHSVMRSGPPGLDLGAVIATEGDEAYVLSHKPPKGTEKDEDTKQAIVDGQFNVDWAGLRIWFTESIAPDRPLKARVTKGDDNKPVEGIDIAFMPKSGAFKRTRTNERGVAQLVPVEDGVVRFSGPSIGLLRIERKKQT